MKYFILSVFMFISLNLEAQEFGFSLITGPSFSNGVGAEVIKDPFIGSLPFSEPFEVWIEIM